MVNTLKEGTILHLFGWDKKFFAPFFDFIHKNFSDKSHKFIVYGNVLVDEVPESPNIVVLSSLLKNALNISRQMNNAEKIIIHGIFSSHLLYLLSFNCRLLKKCYWVVWGGDLYVHQLETKDWRWHKNEFFRRFVIRRIGNLVTYIPGDVDLARKWYGATGQYHECLMYQSNLFKKYDVSLKEHSPVNILVGNSADPSNNHSEVFKRLAPYKEGDIKIFVPLSYGNQYYMQKVIEQGVELFGDKFVPLTTFMPFENYLEFLGQIDIAIFAHKRQQAMGNTITLLGLGKKVYMRNDVTSWRFFLELGVKLFDVARFDLLPINTNEAKKNKQIVSNYFSKDKLLTQLKEVFR